MQCVLLGHFSPETKVGLNLGLFRGETFSEPRASMRRMKATTTTATTMMMMITAMSGGAIDPLDGDSSQFCGGFDNRKNEPNVYGQPVRNIWHQQVGQQVR